MTMAKIVTYRRVSTEEQALHGQSLGAQTEALRRWAAANGHVVLAEFADDGVSAWDTSKVRPGLAELMIFCRHQPVDLVAVYSYDRFSRDMTQSLLARRELERVGARVVSITEPADPNAPEGRLMISILSSFAQFFSDQNSAKTRAGMRHKAASGNGTGGKPPYGYRSENGQLVPGPDIEVERVREIYRLGTDGNMGIKEIVKHLNDKGLTGPCGGRWMTSTVHKILSNPVYCGERVWGKHRSMQTLQGKRRVLLPRAEWVISRDAHAAIITRELFERRQAVAESKAFNERQNHKRPGFWLLSGLLYCDQCGGKYTGNSMKGHGRDYRHYICSTHIKQGAKGCTAKRYLNADEIEEQIIRAIRDEVSKPERIKKIRDALIASYQKQAKKSDTKAIRRKIADTNERLQRLMEAIEAGVCELDDAKGRISALKIERATLESEMLMATGGGKSLLDRGLALVDNISTRFEQTFDLLSFDDRKKALANAVNRIEINQESGEITLHFALNEKGGNSDVPTKVLDWLPEMDLDANKWTSVIPLFAPPRGSHLTTGT